MPRLSNEEFTHHMHICGAVIGRVYGIQITTHPLGNGIVRFEMFDIIRNLTWEMIFNNAWFMLRLDESVNNDQNLPYNVLKREIFDSWLRRVQNQPR